MDILGVDIGGSGIKGAVVDTLTGELKTERIRIPTPQPATPEAVAETLKQLVDQIGFKGPIGCGFPARVIDGEVLTAANIDKSWINVKVEELFTSVVGQQVYVANDADVAGLAELTFGAVKEDLGFKEWGERLNKFLEYIAFLTQPDFIVLGGGVSKKFEKYASKLTLSTKVVPAKTLNLAGIIGAAMYAKTRI